MVALLLADLSSPISASAQESGDGSIFRRFAQRRKSPKYRQTVIEFPILLRPQTQSDAQIEKNLGINYIGALRPQNRLYLSRGFNLAKMEWKPKSPDIDRVRVKTFEMTQILNYNLSSLFVLNFGFGIGLMDGVILFNTSRNFETRLELFIPFHFGVGLRLGDTYQLGLKLAQSTFFKTGPVISVTRVLIGFGYNF